MNKAFLQYWEESERGWGVRPDGCSLHLTKEDHRKYVDNIYDLRNSEYIPDEYDRIIGHIIEVSVSNVIYNILNSDLNLRLFEYEMSNLIRLREIIL